MKRYLGIFAAASMALAAGCGGSGGGPSGPTKDMATPPDMTAPPDMTKVGTSPIGGACKASSDCFEGKGPLCWKKTLLDGANNLPVMGGYCTSKCTSDADCGDNGVCVSFGGAVKYCLGGCQMETDCRKGGYACFYGSGFGVQNSGVCWPDGNLDCDPTAAGTCMTPMMTEGGCVREALGMGMRGVCNQLCAPGTSTCPMDQAGNAQVCIIEDQRWDSMGKASGDKFAGPLCIYSPADQGKLVDVGKDCLFLGNHYTNACVDGAECFLKGKSPANMGFSSMGDNVCHQLCYLPGGMPVGGNPDGGMGMVAGACPNNTTCKDQFGLASAAPELRVGMCL